jgi:hypothetical protein
MALMTVNNQNPHQQAGDCQAQPRWSAGKKTEAVLRLLRGEPLEELSRELKVEAHRAGLSLTMNRQPSAVLTRVAPGPPAPQAAKLRAQCGRTESR